MFNMEKPIRIVVKDLINCLADGKTVSLVIHNTLRIDLTGKIFHKHSAYGGQHKLSLNARTLTNDVETLLKQAMSDEPNKRHVIISFLNFSDSYDSSASVTSSVVNTICSVFRLMNNCTQIIINCDKGVQRAPMIASRVVALLKYGVNEPSDCVYEVYRLICESLCVQNNLEWRQNDPLAWPKLCTNSWTQAEICMFKHRKTMYPSMEGEIVYGQNVYMYIEENASKSDQDEGSESSDTIPFPLPPGIDRANSVDSESSGSSTVSPPLDACIYIPK